MLRLYHGKIPKVVSPRFTTLNWGRGGDEVCSVNVHQISNLGWIGIVVRVNLTVCKFSRIFLKFFCWIRFLQRRFGLSKQVGI